MATTTSVPIAITFHDYWRCGTGEGAGASLDALVARDALGLPRVPGRTIKGVLRDAVATLAQFGHLAKDATEVLFGEAGFIAERAGATGLTPRRATRPGILAFSDALIEHELRDWFSVALTGTSGLAANAKSYRDLMFSSIASTAINTNSGTAIDRSLRNVEVAKPMTLHGTIDLLPAHAGYDRSIDLEIRKDWVGHLQLAAGLVVGIGAQKNRGFGRCQMKIGATK